MPFKAKAVLSLWCRTNGRKRHASAKRAIPGKIASASGAQRGNVCRTGKRCLVECGFAPGIANAKIAELRPQTSGPALATGVSGKFGYATRGLSSCIARRLQDCAVARAAGQQSAGGRRDVRGYARGAEPVGERQVSEGHDGCAARTNTNAGAGKAVRRPEQQSRRGARRDAERCDAARADGNGARDDQRQHLYYGRAGTRRQTVRRSEDHRSRPASRRAHPRRRNPPNPACPLCR